MASGRRVLIDNATLSGVQRLMGVSKTRNLNNIDNDILCLEKLVTAILFSDDLLGIDDYKEEFRAARLKRFNFVSFADFDENRYTQLAADAADFARSMTFSFDGSKPAGDVVRFFDALRIDPQMRWDVWVSSEYLTLSYLVDDPKDAGYEALVDTIVRNEQTDSAWVGSVSDHNPSLSIVGGGNISDIEELVQAFSSANPNYVSENGKSALTRMIFGYGWAAERSFFYNTAAHELDADVSLAPLRDSFCESCCRIDYPSQVISLLETLKSNSQQVLATILEPTGQSKFAMRLPFFTAFLISQADNAEQCVDLALTLRGHGEFRDCRTILQNLDHLSQADRTQELNRIMRFLDQSCEKLMKKYAVSNSNGTQMSLSLGLTGPSLSADLKVGQLLRDYRHKSFARVFRNIAQDMLNVERLGALYDKLRSSVDEHSDTTYSEISKTPRFMEKKESQYGRPAKPD